MEDIRRRRARMNRDTPEIRNLFQRDLVEILSERWEGEEPLRVRKIFVRSLARSGVEGWVNAADVDLIDEP